jgi:hypothetical protein
MFRFTEMLIGQHIFLSSLVAFYLVSNFVDALKLCPPKPTDGRLYLFLYTFIMGIAGNALSATRGFLGRKGVNVKEV